MPQLSEVGVAFVRREPGQAMSEEDVLAHCRGRIASFKIPATCSSSTTSP
jgi:acyl-CoA synthetase (AMP-forming)/AMP-acid ligase II